MRVLTVNPGSGSLRIHLVETDTGEVVDSRKVGHPPQGEDARAELSEFLTGAPPPAAVAHRLVHGGEHVTAPRVVDAATVDDVRAASSLAPQHVPATVSLLEFLRVRLPDVPHVLCPDTAFHAALPEVARTLALPAQWRSNWGLRRYGFHGVSLAWAMRRACELLGRPVDATSLLVAHLSGGSSVTAIHNGRSVDTSMGFTPLEGVPMSKRSGSVDPGLLLWLLREGKLSVAELADGLEQHSGLLGLSDGYSGDTRDLVRAAAAGDTVAQRAMDVFAHRIRRELAAVAASLTEVHALVFTGDIGWDQPEVAEAVSGGLALLGLRGGLDRRRDADAVISAAGAGVPVLAVRSREELELANETARELGHRHQ